MILELLASAEALPALAACIGLLLGVHHLHVLVHLACGPDDKNSIHLYNFAQYNRSNVLHTISVSKIFQLQINAANHIVLIIMRHCGNRGGFCHWPCSILFFNYVHVCVG